MHIINLSSYTSPQISESKKGEFVEYGSDNNYFQFLIDRYLYSTTNNAIITGVANMIYGKGIGALDANKKPDEYAKMVSIIKPNTLKKVGLERKLLGMAAMQIGYDKGQVSFIDHFPMHTLRAEKCNDKGEIEAWYYSPDWSKRKPNDELKRIPAFGYGNGKEVEIYVIKPYISGYHYYTPIDYSGAIPYAKLEEEISDYLINDVQNGFSGTKVVNFNNGVPPEEKREEIVRNASNKLQGAKGQKVIYGFSNSKENATEVIDIPLNDAPAHYEYLSKECFEKLIVGHRVTSPMLLGVRSGDGGLGNNADEIKTATLLYDNLVIKPYQIEIIEALGEILVLNNIKLKLYFKTIQPLEFTDLENAQNSEQVTEETGIQMSKHLDSIKLEDFGEDINLDEWELVDSRKVDYDTEEQLDAELKLLNSPKASLLSKIYSFVSTGSAYTKRNSEQDNEIFRTRYRYSGEIGSNTRDFCSKMLGANKLYRKEDIIQMGSQAVNEGFGPNGADNYSIWLYKGGGACHHFWTRETYRRKGTDITSPLAQTVTPSQQRKEGYLAPVNDKKVYQRPIDMPNKGFLPK